MPDLQDLCKAAVAEANDSEQVEAYAEESRHTEVRARKGEVTTPVRGANLIGQAIPVMSAVDAVADDFDTWEGTCGKDGQMVPVGAGRKRNDRRASQPRRSYSGWVFGARPSCPPCSGSCSPGRPGR